MRKEIKKGVILGFLCGSIFHFVLLFLILMDFTTIHINQKIIHPQYSLLSPFFAEMRVFSVLNEYIIFVLSFLHWGIMGGFAGILYRGILKFKKMPHNIYSFTVMPSNIIIVILYVSILALNKSNIFEFGIAYQLFSDLLSIMGQSSILRDFFEINAKANLEITLKTIGGVQLVFFGFFAGFVMDFGKYLLNKYGRMWPITLWLEK